MHVRSMTIRRFGSEKYYLGAIVFSVVCAAVFLRSEALGVSGVPLYGVMAVLGVMTCVSLGFGLAAPIVLDIGYSNGRGVQITCLSWGHAEEIKAIVHGHIAAVQS